MTMQEDLIIRPAIVEDGPAIVDIHVRSWQWAYRGLLPDEYLANLGSNMERRLAWWGRTLPQLPPDERYWVAERAGQILGFAGTLGVCRDPDAPPQTAELPMIYLDPESAGQGVGRALFAQAIGDLRERGYARATLW